MSLGSSCGNEEERTGSKYFHEVGLRELDDREQI